MCHLRLCASSFPPGLSEGVVRAFALVFTKQLSGDVGGGVQAADVLGVDADEDEVYIADVKGRVEDFIAEQGGR